MVCTDLSSLIGIFNCGYSIVWKFSNFPVILILREISFSWFQKVKLCCLTIFRKISGLKMSKFLKNWKFRAAQLVKMVVFGASKWLKMISRKIWVSDTSSNFHIVYCQCPFPIKLSRSVIAKILSLNFKKG